MFFLYSINTNIYNFRSMNKVPAIRVNTTKSTYTFTSPILGLDNIAYTYYKDSIIQRESLLVKVIIKRSGQLQIDIYSQNT